MVSSVIFPFIFLTLIVVVDLFVAVYQTLVALTFNILSLSSRAAVGQHTRPQVDASLLGLATVQ